MKILRTTLGLFCLVSRAFSTLNFNLVGKYIEEIATLNLLGHHFDGFVMDLPENDSDWPEFAKLSEQFTVLTDLKFCKGDFLKVISSEKLLNFQQIEEKEIYIKDPCLTYLVIFEDSKLLTQILGRKLLKHQPFIFALEIRNLSVNLLEVQIYANKIELIGFWNPEKTFTFSQGTIHKPYEQQKGVGILGQF